MKSCKFTQAELSKFTSHTNVLTNGLNNQLTLDL